MDINKIFSSFVKSKEEKSGEQGLSDKHPYFISGVIYKSILGLDDYVIHSYKMTYSNSITKDDKKYAEYYKTCKVILYHNCYLQLCKLDVDDQETMHYMLKHPVDKMLCALNLMLKYYETLEEYERCCVIKDFLDAYEKLSLTKGLDI